LLHPKFSNYPFGISLGKKLDDSILDNLIDGPTLEYYNHYNNINNELADLTQRIHEDLHTIKINSIPIKPTISLGSGDYEKYLKSLSYDISHKMVATRAGLGWIGKTDLLISKKFGPRLRLVTILLDRDPGIIAIPIDKSKCGKCNICVEKCPAQAANGILWNIKVHRDNFFNAFKCREKCGELAKQRLDVDERICGLCVSVCPIGKK
jgi:epoxyqueuosine reductase QueG